MGPLVFLLFYGFLDFWLMSFFDMLALRVPVNLHW